MFRGITPNPDPGFQRKLKDFDPKLTLEFNRKLSKFVITQPSRLSGRVIAHVIEGNSGFGFRHPDDRDIATLHRADWHRRKQEYKDRVREGEEQAINLRKKEMADAEDEIKARTRENKNQLYKTYCKAMNLGKGSTGYRPITPKSKGYTVKDLRKIKEGNGGTNKD